MKVIRYDREHRDIYAYSSPERLWVKIACSLRGAMICTAPWTLPRGSRFNYNIKETAALADSAANVLAVRDAQR
jgi:hypothetical protein